MSGLNVPDIPPLSDEDYMKFQAWWLAKQTGWTLDYIDTLSIERMHEIVQMEDAIAKAHKIASRRA
jgi:hypothetical protein